MFDGYDRFNDFEFDKIMVDRKKIAIDFTYFCIHNLLCKI